MVTDLPVDAFRDQRVRLHVVSCPAMIDARWAITNAPGVSGPSIQSGRCVGGAVSAARDAVIVGVGISDQGRRLEAVDSLDVMWQAASAAIVDAGIDKNAIDGYLARGPGPEAPDWTQAVRIGRSCSASRCGGCQTPTRRGCQRSPLRRWRSQGDLCDTVLIVNGQAGALVGSVGGIAPWTRPANEFTEPYDAPLAALFALIAARYQHDFGLTERDLACTLRQSGPGVGDARSGHVRARSVYGEEDILASPYIAEPLRLLNICLATEGAAALIVTTRERAADLPKVPIEILGIGMVWERQQYVNPPVFSQSHLLGKEAADRAFAQAGLRRDEIDVFQLHDANAFEIVRQMEALGYAEPGNGVAFLRERGIGVDGVPINMNGGCLRSAIRGTRRRR